MERARRIDVHHHTSVWGARPEAAPEDVLVTWQQLVALHRQWHSLTRELKDAEQALGQDNTEANYARLRDVKARLSTLDGTEALIEGFGASSGRGARQLIGGRRQVSPCALRHGLRPGRAGPMRAAAVTVNGRGIAQLAGYGPIPAVSSDG